MVSYFASVPTSALAPAPHVPVSYKSAGSACTYIVPNKVTDSWAQYL